MILGDSLQVMASLAEREGLRGKVQCIYCVLSVSLQTPVQGRRVGWRASRGSRRSWRAGGIS